jgi:hypothetical protein
MAYAAVPVDSRRVEMWFNGPEQQRRWTVLIRFILAIPQFIVLAFLEIAWAFVTIIGWFAALFTGRLPGWAHNYNSGFVRWYQRVLAYTYLLTDEYPPFEFDDLPYPARPIVPSVGPLNRAAVFFRIVLVIPAYFLQAVVSYGLAAPLLFVTWLIMVFTGRMPQALYGAYSSLVRYQARVFSYVSLLTSEYPWGMLGDRGPQLPFAFQPPTGPAVAPPMAPMPYASPTPSTAAAPPTATTTAEAVPTGETGTEGVGAGREAPPVTSPLETLGQPAAPIPPPAAPAWPPPPPPNFATPGRTTPPPWGPAPPPPPPPGAHASRSGLVLSRASRGWLIFAIVWGSILFVGQISVQAVVAGSNLSTSIRQYNTVVNDYNASSAAIEKAVNDSKSCTTVQCVRPSHLAAASSLEKFDSDLKAMNLACTATHPAQVVESDLTQLASAFTDLANSANAQAYISTLQSSNLNTVLQSLPNDTNTLLAAMQSSNLGSFCAG